MTETERIVLLKAVAKCAPKEMDATFHEADEINEDGYIQDRVWFRTLGALFLDEREDASDEPAICFAMLDAMEGAGWLPFVVRCCEETTEGQGITIPGRYEGSAWLFHRRARRTLESGYVCQVFSTGGGSELKHELGGSTRAEALSKAFVQVFGKEKPQA